MKKYLFVVLIAAQFHSPLTRPAFAADSNPDNRRADMTDEEKAKYLQEIYEKCMAAAETKNRMCEGSCESKTFFKQSCLKGCHDGYRSDTWECAGPH